MKEIHSGGGSCYSCAEPSGKLSAAGLCPSCVGYNDGQLDDNRRIFHLTRSQFSEMVLEHPAIKNNNIVGGIIQYIQYKPESDSYTIYLDHVQEKTVLDTMIEVAQQDRPKITHNAGHTSGYINIDKPKTHVCELQSPQVMASRAMGVDLSTSSWPHPYSKLPIGSNDAPSKCDLCSQKAKDLFPHIKEKTAGYQWVCDSCRKILAENGVRV